MSNEVEYLSSYPDDGFRNIPRLGTLAVPQLPYLRGPEPAPAWTGFDSMFSVYHNGFVFYELVYVST